MTPAEIGWAKDGLLLAPSLVGALLIVAMFLRYLAAKEKQDSMTSEKRDKLIESIALKAFEVHQESSRVIRENTEMMGKVKVTLEHVNSKLAMRM